jgi:hypothetical protein
MPSLLPYNEPDMWDYDPFPVEMDDDEEIPIPDHVKEALGFDPEEDAE